MSANKFRTGDLYFSNKYSISGIMTRMMDPDSKWSDVGVVRVIEEDNEAPQIMVFILTKQGAREISLDRLLKDPTLQSAAHRSITAKDKNAYVNSIIRAMQDLRGEIPEQISVLLDDSRRTGYTKSEIAGKILTSVGLISYHDGIKTSQFQEGGSLDDVYGPEYPLFPRKSDYNRESAISMAAQEESVDIIMEYMDNTPIADMNAFMESRNNVNSSKHRFMPQNSEYARAQAPEQKSNIERLTRKKQTVHDAETDSTDSINRRLRRLQRDKDALKAADEKNRKKTTFLPQ